jgi:hypothetical protein
VRSHKKPSATAAPHSSECHEDTTAKETYISPSQAWAEASDSSIENHIQMSAVVEEQQLHTHTLAWNGVQDNEDPSLISMGVLNNDDDIEGEQPGFLVEDDSAASGTSTASGPRRKFVAHSGSREQVMGQLAGLRRKVAYARG